jgi:hypothetical protein
MSVEIAGALNRLTAAVLVVAVAVVSDDEQWQGYPAADLDRVAELHGTMVDVVVHGQGGPDE